MDPTHDLLSVAESLLRGRALTRFELQKAVPCGDELARRLITVLLSQKKIEVVRRQREPGNLGPPFITYRTTSKLNGAA